MSKHVDIAAELDFALHLADLADAHTLSPFYRRDFSVDWKENKTEVTELDRATESPRARSRPPHAMLPL